MAPKYEVDVVREGAPEHEQGYTLNIVAANANSAKEKAEASFIGGFNAVKARKVDEDEEPGDPVELTPEQVAAYEAEFDRQVELQSEERANAKLKAALEDQEAEIERQVQERIAKLEEERAPEPPVDPKVVAETANASKPATKAAAK